MSTVDFFVVTVMILSIILAVLRGFTREVLTIVGFVGATAAVTYGLPVAGPLFEGMFQDPTTAKIAAGVVLGLGTLIVLSLISHQISKGINKVGLGMVDRILGIAFGVARAALVLCILYVGLRWAYGPKLPDWITNAKSTPLIARTSDRLVSFLPATVQADIQPTDDKAAKAKADAKDSVNKAAEKVDTMTQTPPAPPEKPDETPASDEGYSKLERGALNKLLEKDIPTNTTGGNMGR